MRYELLYLVPLLLSGVTGHPRPQDPSQPLWSINFLSGGCFGETVSNEASYGPVLCEEVDQGGEFDSVVVDMDPGLEIVFYQGAGCGSGDPTYSITASGCRTKAGNETFDAFVVNAV